ncbi:unnamed protein product [Clonostachys rosea]|uniref:DUF4203 domain-containing protein n=1 Tax=Bionectria ochroleuca TaxID=29856 RepID=A0ABY6V3Y5_BIOOC|nr:unnamed protein product [Clonostachys rosea]
MVTKLQAHIHHNQNFAFIAFAGAFLGLCTGLLWTGLGAVMMSYHITDEYKGATSLDSGSFSTLVLSWDLWYVLTVSSGGGCCSADEVDLKFHAKKKIFVRMEVLKAPRIQPQSMPPTSH